MLECFEDIEIESIGLGKHELIAIDRLNRFYTWEWEFSRRLRKMHEVYTNLSGTRRLGALSTTQYYLKGIIIPEKTQIVNFSQEGVCNSPLNLELQLYDQFGECFPSEPNISLVFKKENSPATPTQNSSLEFSMQHIENDSNTCLEVTPYSYGEYFVHIFVDNSEIGTSPVVVKISPTEEQEASEREKLAKTQRLQEAQRRKQELKRAKELELQKARQLQQEESQKKKQETQQRAQEALKGFREKQKAQKALREEERKRRLELKVGGGYKLDKK